MSLYGTKNSYAGFDELLGKRESRKIGNNTYAQRREDGSIAIRLHATDVVTYHEDGTVTLNSGGYETVTTKDRFNRFGPEGITVYSSKGAWLVHCLPYGDNNNAPFISGMRFNPSPERFAETTAPYRSAGYDLERSRKATEAKIKRFLSGLTEERLSETLESAASPMGLLGDCLICRMEWSALRDASEIGNVRKISLTDNSHLLSHIEEGYYFGSLFMNALVWIGYREWQLRFNMDSSTLKRALRRYLKTRLQDVTLDDWKSAKEEVSA